MNSPVTDPAKLEPPSEALLRKLEKATIHAACKLLGMPDRPKRKAPRLTPEQEEQIREIEANAIGNYVGDLTQLESALGMLRIGHYVGWRVLYLIHSKKTVRTYEDVLGIRVRELFAETGPLSDRSVGLNLAMRFSNFWKVAGGDIKIPRRQDIA